MATPIDKQASFRCINPVRNGWGLARHRHQLDSPIGGCAAAGFAMTGAEIDGRGRLAAPRAAETAQNLRERPVTAVAGDHAHVTHRQAFAAMQFETAIRPIGQPMGGEERWRVHGRQTGMRTKIEQ